MSGESSSLTDALDSELYRALEDDLEEDDEPQSKRQQLHSVDPGALAPAEPEDPLLATGDFAALSDDLALEVLACLSAADLTALAQCSRFFRGAAADNDLWRALFLARWGDKLDDNNKLHDSKSWKDKYMDRDAQDVADVQERVPTSMQSLYLQMSTAKRALTLPRRRSLAPLSDVALKGRISRWRGARGLLNCPSPKLSSEHKGCSKMGPFAALEGGLFMCESCGWAHLCGEGCTERFLDTQAEQLVCPVSGHSYDMMLEDLHLPVQKKSYTSALHFC